MRFFITGLCLQGNKGGPAIGLSLMSQIRRHDPSAEFVFSVPSNELRHEQEWGKRYGVEVVENFNLKDLLPPFCLYPFPLRLKRIRNWLRAMADSDAVIEMSAISYVGPPLGSNISVLRAGRFHYWLLARLLRKPFVAWTQSYGPLSTRLVRFMCRLDLGTQQVVMCRGDDCRIAVQELMPNADAVAFPDVAAILPHDPVWGREYLARFGANARREKIATVSPSAEIQHRTRVSGQRPHIDDVTDIVRHLGARGYTVILVPHTFRPDRHTIEDCDWAVARVVHERTKGDHSVLLVSDDLSPIEIKSLISQAHVHIGARYHSIVASLSTAVPTLALSWHPKYLDIMRMYGAGAHVIESLAQTGETSPAASLDRLIAKSDTMAVQLREAQVQVAEAIEENARLFVRILRESWNLEIGNATGLQDMRLEPGEADGHHPPIHGLPGGGL